MDKIIKYVYINRMLSEDPFAMPMIEYVDLVIITCLWESEEHVRPVWKLYWNSNPGASLFFKNERIPLLADQLYLIAPMTPYVPVCSGNVEHFYIHFHLPRDHSKLPHGIWTIKPDLFRFSQMKSSCSGGFKTFSQRLLLFELLTHSLGQLPEELFEQNQPHPLSGVYPWLEKNLYNDCSNTALAALTGFSDDTLNRLFLKETGKTPQNYVRSLRISRAANLLRQTNMTMEEIAEQCGYCDRSHFHKSFKKRLGISPVIYREKLQNP